MMNRGRRGADSHPEGSSAGRALKLIQQRFDIVIAKTWSESHRLSFNLEGLPDSLVLACCERETEVIVNQLFE
jgi:hypothetical protein